MALDPVPRLPDDGAPARGLRQEDEVLTHCVGMPSGHYFGGGAA